MKAMSHHDFFDDDVEEVLFSGHKNNREIVLKESNEGSLLISKDDIIAFAREFGLFVFEKDSAL